MKAVLKRPYWFIRRLTGLSLAPLIALKHLPRFFRELSAFRAKGGVVDRLWPILTDYQDDSGTASGHYFHQDLLVAQFIFSANPADHLDIASRIDGFVAHVAAFRAIDVMDVRPLQAAAHANIRFLQRDLMVPQPDLAGRYPSVSCLHALEHFGLGRYTDSIDPDGHRKGFAAIAALVAPGGVLYLSVPVGRPRVEFNAHRIFAPDGPLSWAVGQFTLERFDYVDDRGALQLDKVPADADGLDYGCGIYTLRKAR
ncbi:MAG: DUF268 domain-containing protein [Sphingomonas sp.]|uniref:DUF268 domain-containing protein n=1 Tax=Sphingomonas sp. TaxID=28214 RepID=UPI0035A84F1D|nr:DUF268 domain-containing protein [Sphingomonas sp.]